MQPPDVTTLTTTDSADVANGLSHSVTFRPLNAGAVTASTTLSNPHASTETGAPSLG